ncbi:MAG TPA: hypothetical protein PKK45_06375 [Leptospiraceae bacterium]|nr:hypothetical protein [Leptospiraceae bacterium]HNN58422.1 hypothetical protein [Leptospiraceae bacterium]
MKRRNFRKARAVFQEGLELIPHPAYEWEAATWFFTAIADAAFLSGDNQGAANYLQMARKCPDGLANPFILLRLGQALTNLGEKEEGVGFLLEAFMVGGHDVFLGEHPRYWNLIQPMVEVIKHGATSRD